jgi:hypothetical protein
MAGSSFGTEGIIKNTMHFLFCCTFHMIQDDGGIGSTKKGWGVHHYCCSISASFFICINHKLSRSPGRMMLPMLP